GDCHYAAVDWLEWRRVHNLEIAHRVPLDSVVVPLHPDHRLRRALGRERRDFDFTGLAVGLTRDDQRLVRGCFATMGEACAACRSPLRSISIGIVSPSLRTIRHTTLLPMPANFVTGCPSTFRILSPACSPAFSAGEFGIT